VTTRGRETGKSRSAIATFEFVLLDALIDCSNQATKQHNGTVQQSSTNRKVVSHKSVSNTMGRNKRQCQIQNGDGSSRGVLQLWRNSYLWDQRARASSKDNKQQPKTQSVAPRVSSSKFRPKCENQEKKAPDADFAGVALRYLLRWEGGI